MAGSKRDYLVNLEHPFELNLNSMFEISVPYKKSEEKNTD